jgi:hypothetical protein
VSRRIPAAVVALIAAVLCAPLAFAQTESVEVQAYVQPASGITDVTQVRLVIEVAGVRNPQIEDPQIGQLQNLRMLRNHPSVEQSTSIANGRVSSSYRLSYVLLPERLGSASIPALRVVVDGKTYTTDPIAFEVTSSPKRPPASGRSEDGSGSSGNVVFAESKLSREEIWVGEPVMTTASVYSTLRVHDIALAEVPAFSQFLATTVPVDINAEATRAEIGGRGYAVYPVRRDLLIPLGPGSYSIDPYTIQVKVQSRRDVFDLFARGTAVMRRTEPLTLMVKPLPTGAPSGFGGAVGNFAFKASLDREEVAVNDAVALRLTVEGEGSLQTVDPPRWEAPSGVKVYDPESSLETNIRNGRLISRKSWEWVLVPLAPGDIDLGALQFAYFEPREGAYRSASADPLRLAVVEGDGLPVASSGAPDRSVISLDQKDIAFIKPLRGETLAYVTPRLHQRGWFVSLAFMPLFWVPFFVWLGRRRDLLQRDRGLARDRRAKRRARKALKVIRKHSSDHDGAAFHEEVARTLVSYVGDRFNRSPSGLTYELADELLTGRGIDESLRQRFRACLETCDFARFVPASAKAERRAEVLAEATALIDELERTW